MTHPYKNYLICRDDYFDNPEQVIELSNHVNYSRSTYFPGERTGNLLGMEDKKIKDFADWFANRLSFDIFPGIRMFELMLCFHRNFPSPDPYYNRGLIHNDVGNLAGLIYLTPGEHDLNTGTSIFDNDTIPRTEPTELDTDAAALKEFYLFCAKFFNFSLFLVTSFTALITSFTDNPVKFKKTIKMLLL
jgi:hypothetical protein